MNGTYLAEQVKPGYVGAHQTSAWRCAYCGATNGNHWFCSCGCHHAGPCGRHAQPECDRPA